MMRRAFTRLGTITAGWSKSIRKQQNLSADDKKKWASSQDFSRKYDWRAVCTASGALKLIPL